METRGKTLAEGGAWSHVTPWRRWLVSLTLFAMGDAGSRKTAGPLCHKEFRALELCIGNVYERLNSACAEDHGQMKACLASDWKHIDAAGSYKRGEGSFNRMRRCRHGLMMYNPLDWYIGRGLEVYGEWGQRKVDIWRRFVKAGQVAVEVGAHVGTLTLPLAALVGNAGRVVAFEPFYPSFATLAANVGLNSLQNVEVRQAVVSDQFGRVFMSRANLAFGMHDFFNFGSMSFDALKIYNMTEDVERPSAQWDEYQVMPLDLLSVSRLDFVKIDAEAMELSVIRGASRMLKKFKPVLFIEYRSPWEKDTHLLDFLMKLRYECVLLRIPIFNTENFRGHSEDIYGGATKLVSFNLLCKHRWWEYRDMDGDILELFDTAVDTEIEGLRTTPTADPFEALALSRRGGDETLPERVDKPHNPERRTSAATPESENSREMRVTAHERAAGATSQRGQRVTFDDVTLDELLGDDVASARKHATREDTKRRYASHDAKPGSPRKLPNEGHGAKARAR
eukprot:CAMPEP_0117470642 /NCGR_PEP_ID=MMETSP0784-20121206/7320_1 /TAXON_ID=39447 /ORGANISM="" /LENGTH=508 /DNA_ID=CAMNT_0005264735 /DNA_START=38 /DNA_END=1561 /DNA_ORIENTATION=-